MGHATGQHDAANLVATGPSHRRQPRVVPKNLLDFRRLILVVLFEQDIVSAPSNCIQR